MKPRDEGVCQKSSEEHRNDQIEGDDGLAHCRLAVDIIRRTKSHLTAQTQINSTPVASVACRQNLSQPDLLVRVTNVPQSFSSNFAVFDCALTVNFKSLVLTSVYFLGIAQLLSPSFAISGGGISAIGRL